MENALKEFHKKFQASSVSATKLQSCHLGGILVVKIWLLLRERQRQTANPLQDKSGLGWASRGATPVAKKYTFLERSYEPDSSEDEEDGEEEQTERKSDRSRSSSPAKCTLAPALKSLMELVFNQQYIDSTMADMNYDAMKMPLGKLSHSTITRGYQALKELSALLDGQSLDDDSTTIEDLSNRYYSYIPHAFGRLTSK